MVDLNASRSADGSLELLGRLMAEFESRAVRYVHWKSNTNIDKALAGLDDFDILVHPADQQLTEEIFSDLLLVRAKSPKDEWQANIYHYVGADLASCSLAHVHVHYALPMGFDYDKNVVLPIVDDYLAGRWKYGPVYLPEVEMEYAVLVLRLILKNTLGTLLLELPHRQYRRIRSAASGVIAGGGLAEFRDLSSRLDRQRLDVILKTSFSFLQRSTFDACEATVLRNNSLTAYFSAGSLLKKELAAYSTNSPIMSFSKAFWRLNMERCGKLYRRIFKLPPPRKLLATGGRITAFVGGDGAGKSTNVDALYDTLKREISTVKLHIGRPPKSPAGLLAKVVARLLRLLGAAAYAQAFAYLATALDRGHAFRRALSLREKGWHVVVDRVPLEGITRMDCPRIRTLNKSGLDGLARWETRLHQRIAGVDQLIVLKLDPQIALRRRPEDDAEELQARSGEIWQEKWVAPYATVVDTGVLSPLEVRRKVLEQVWCSSVKPFSLVELIGLSGAGKSSLIRLLREKIPNLSHSLPYRRYPLVSFFGMVSGIPAAVRAYAKTGNWQVAKNCLQLFAAVSLISRFRKTSFPATNFVLDQGPVFQYALFLREGVLSAAEEMRIKECCRDIKAIKLVVSRDELFHRVSLRANHTGRVPVSDRQEFERYCDSYEKGFDVAVAAAASVKQVNANQEMSGVVRDILAAEIA